MPKRTDELWRFSNLAGVKLDGFTLPAAVHPGDYQGASLGFTPTAQLVFANNTLVHRVPLAPALAARA